MAFSDYSTNPDQNTSIGGVFVGEQCSPANLNNAIRRIAADGRLLADSMAPSNAAMPLAGGVFTGDIRRQGRGGYLHVVSPTSLSGKVYLLPEGTALPAGEEGALVFFYQ